MLPLPIDQTLPDLLKALRQSRAVVLVAPPGAGKTTRVPPAILRAGLLHKDHPNLVLLQPRRVAARAVAMRIAEENNWTLGQQVGYHVRFDRQLTHQTRLRVLTEGILTRQLIDDPLLDGVGCVILDEFHERNLNTDLALALLKEVQQARPDLLLVVMSATLDAKPVAQYLDHCPILESQGRTFPVEISYQNKTGATLENTIRATVEKSLTPSLSSGEGAGSSYKDGTVSSNNPEGDILIFLPGANEIRQTLTALSHLSDDFDLLPLHGSLPAEDQIRAIRPSRRRKIIAATNIAETSLTIEGVTLVIDTGLARIASFDPQRGLDRLDLAPISKASAAQRAGRAGRVRPGRCIRLYSQKEFNALDDFDLPEIRRVDLAQTLLTLHGWGTAPDQFPWYENPDPDTLDSAHQLLESLGALTPGQLASSSRSTTITPLGRKLLSLPTHPRIARLLLEAQQNNLTHQGGTLAALLSEKDIFFPNRADRFSIGSKQTKGDSDLLIRLDALEHFHHDDRIDPAAVRQVLKVRDDLLRILNHRTKNHPPADHADLMRIPLLAYPDRVCKRRESNPTLGVMVGGGGVRLADESVVRDGDFFLALDARHDARSRKSEALVRIAHRIDAQWLQECFPHLIRKERIAVYDDSKQRVLGKQQLWYQDLLLREDLTGEVDPEQATKALLDALTPSADELLDNDPHLAPLLRRIEFLTKNDPTGRLASASRLPSVTDLLPEACGRATTKQQVIQNLRNLFESHLTYPVRKHLDDHAPESIAVPTGNRVKLDWSTTPPVLAVRLQELFGLPDTPRIAHNQIPVILHLLGPNYRPVQVTSDLASFWKNTYPQVRKDLRARYPKHSWPEDPLAAPPTARGGRRR